MDNLSAIVIGAVIGLAIWSWILGMIIKSSLTPTQSLIVQQIKKQNIQIRLLSELLMKNGVEKDQIKEIIDLDKPYFNEKIDK